MTVFKILFSFPLAVLGDFILNALLLEVYRAISCLTFDIFYFAYGKIRLSRTLDANNSFDIVVLKLSNIRLSKLGVIPFYSSYLTTALLPSKVLLTKRLILGEVTKEFIKEPSAKWIFGLIYPIKVLFLFWRSLFLDLI